MNQQITIVAKATFDPSKVFEPQAVYQQRIHDAVVAALTRTLGLASKPEVTVVVEAAKD